MFKGISKLMESKAGIPIPQISKTRLNNMGALTFPGVIKLTPQAEQDLLQISKIPTVESSDLNTFKGALKLVEQKGVNAKITGIKHYFVPNYDETFLRLTINGKEIPISTKNVYNDGLKQEEKIANQLSAII